jgi:hypothetical protein
LRDGDLSVIVRHYLHGRTNKPNADFGERHALSALLILVVVKEAGDLLSQCKGLIFFTQRCGPLKQRSLYVGGQLVPLHQPGTAKATQDVLFLLTELNALSALRFGA